MKVKTHDRVFDDSVCFCTQCVAAPLHDLTSCKQLLHTLIRRLRHAFRPIRLESQKYPSVLKSSVFCALDRQLVGLPRRKLKRALARENGNDNKRGTDFRGTGNLLQENATSWPGKSVGRAIHRNVSASPEILGENRHDPTWTSGRKSQGLVAQIGTCMKSPSLFINCVESVSRREIRAMLFAGWIKSVG